MRQALNIVNIEGILKEINLVEKDDSKGRHYITGDVTFLVKQTISIPETNIVKVRVYAYELTKAGKVNPAYTNAYDILHKGVSIAATGSEDNADWYSVGGASLRENSFVGRDGRTVDYSYVQGSFFRKIAPGDFTAKFSVEPVILSMREEIVDDVPTGRLLVDTVIVQYNDNPDKITFVVEDTQAVDYIQSNYQPYDTVRVDGKLRYTTKMETVISDEVLGFGSADPKVVTNTVKEYVITSGSAGPLDEQLCFDKAEIIKAIEDKKMRQESRNTAASEKSSPKITRGF